MTHQRTVYLIDDDQGDRHYLAFRLGTAGIEAWPFSGPDSFLASLETLTPKLILVSVEAEPHWGAEFVGLLQRRDIDWPVIALSRTKDVSVVVDTMKLGAIDFLAKPVDEEKLQRALSAGNALLDSRLEARRVRREAQQRVMELTARELCIGKALLSGQPNKIIAHNLGISVRTVEAHRANIMMKLHARSTSEVLLLMIQAGLAPTPAEGGIAPAIVRAPQPALPPRTTFRDPWLTAAA